MEPLRPPGSAEASHSVCETSVHVRRAAGGDQESLEWIVVRLSPLLLLQARERLGKTLIRLYDPADLVQDAWAITLPKLAELPARHGRYTPVVLRFLSSCVVNRVNTLLRKHLGRIEATRRELEGRPLEFAELPAETTGVFESVRRSEIYQRILATLESLEEEERRLVLLRCVEQCSTEEVGLLLGLKPNTVVVKCRRALEKLRRRLPKSVFDEVDAEDEVPERS